MTESTPKSEVKIYLIIDRKNNKCYVGQTKTSLRRRFYEHCWEAENRGTQKLHRAIREHGKENFKIYHQLTVPEDRADDEEKKSIRVLNTIENGYNTSLGGRHTPALGMRHTEEWKKEHSQRVTGSGHPLFGKHRSKETRAKISVAHKGKDGRKDIPGACLLILYVDHSTRELCSLFNTTRRTVRDKLVKAGVKIRSGGRIDRSGKLGAAVRERFK